MERESKLRAIVRSVPKDNKESDDLTTTVQLSTTSEAKSESKDDVPETKSSKEEGGEAKGLDAAAVSKRVKSGRPGLPMWALTEDKAAEVTTAVEEDELDDLLEFAKNLGVIHTLSYMSTYIKYQLISLSLVSCLSFKPHMSLSYNFLNL